MMKLLYYFFSRLLHLLHFELVQLEHLSHLPSTAPHRLIGSVSDG